MPLDAIEQLLRTEIGLDLESIGRPSLRIAVDDRLRTLRRAGERASDQDYVDRLRNDPAEVGRLVQEIVVPETWFFRDVEPFSHVARRALTKVTHARGSFRVLCAPCSTGEEPYSVAMAVLDAGLPLECTEIVGCDVSPRVVEVARRGHFSSFSFRGDDLGYRERHFVPAGAQWEIAPRIRAAVTFQTGNLLDPSTWAAQGRYDAIFCRNLLIYLTRDARAKLVEQLAAHLVDDGCVYVGHAERLELIDARFRAAPETRSFGYLVGRQALTPPGAPSAAPTRRPPASMPILPVLPAPTPAPPVRTPAAPAAVLRPLERAAQLADQGQLREAASLCEAQLRDAGPSAEAFELLGVVRLASGDSAAAQQCFERALYLDSQRYGALVQLALLCERRGDDTGAANLRRRADKLKQSGTGGRGR